jgi:hypothetical protein
MTFIAYLLIGRTDSMPARFLGQQRMVALTAKINPEIKQAGGRTHKYTERASNEKDHGYHETLHTQGQG